MPVKILFFLRYFRDQASSRVRGFYMAEALQRAGINSNIICGYNKKAYLKYLLSLGSHDVIYFQKRYTGIDIKFNRFARLLGKKTIFDIDDAPSGVGLDPEIQKQTIQMIENSSVVVVGSQKLKNYAQKYSNHVHLIPSSINLKYYRPKIRKDKNHVTLGWIGNGIGYKNDLRMLIKPLESIGEKYDIKLIIVGALKQKEIHHSFGGMKNVAVEIVDSIDWADPEAVPSIISGFDIGLYPLLDNEYNQYKCGFKALEYMAMKIPVVASPVGENVFIVEDGDNGFIASNEREWEEKLSYLIGQSDIRKRMGNKGRGKIEKDYSIEMCANKLISLFQE
jgi:glycosyltransferase involved in cell wall biosynthesis